jgi:hypothetical protein
VQPNPIIVTWTPKELEPWRRGPAVTAEAPDNRQATLETEPLRYSSARGRWALAIGWPLVLSAFGSVVFLWLRVAGD